jgi:16S rRNA pseudouridine516 synthase
MTAKAPMARLDRLLANLGYGSRREVADLVRHKQVELDGVVMRDAGARVPVTPDLPSRMTVVGRPVDPPAPLILLMHKPLDVVCSHKEPGRSVYDLLPARWRARMPALSTVGRLDKDTTGLLLITDDGDFLHRVISPRRHGALQGHEAEAFAAGTLVLEGEVAPLAPARLEPLDSHRAYLTISEGRYHQVRRMFAAMGNHVLALHRDRVGGLDLPSDLEPGAWRVATVEEQAAIFV